MNVLLKRTVLLFGIFLFFILQISWRYSIHSVTPTQNLEELTEQLQEQNEKDPSSLAFAFQKVLETQKQNENNPPSSNPSTNEIEIKKIASSLEKLLLQFPQKKTAYDQILSLFSESLLDQMLKSYLLLEIFQDQIPAEVYTEYSLKLLSLLKNSKEDTLKNLFSFLDRLENYENTSELGITKASFLNLSNTIEGTPETENQSNALKYAYQEILKNNSQEDKKLEAHAQVLSLLQNPKLELEATLDAFKNSSDPKTKKIVIERFLLKNPSFYNDLVNSLPPGTFEEI